MRKILKIYVFILLSNISYSQTDTLKIKEEYYPKWIYNSPGKELTKASNHYYGGFALSIIGSGIYVLGINSSNTAQTNTKEIQNVGLGIMILGSVLMFESQIHIRRAGIILDNRGIGIKIPIGKK
jgi:hypothetical protein